MHLALPDERHPRRRANPQTNWDIRHDLILVHRRDGGLLTRIVTRGYLEVCVAFRVHMTTGEPLTVDVLDDGHVHLLWAIFTDVDGPGCTPSVP